MTRKKQTGSYIVEYIVVTLLSGVVFYIAAESVFLPALQDNQDRSTWAISQPF